MSNCLTELVGFQPTPCIDVTMPSRSGYYLGDSEHGIELQDFSQADLNKTAGEASEDLLGLLLLNVTRNRTGIVPEHLIGVGLNTTNWTEKTGWHGWFIGGKVYKGVTLKISTISANINYTGDVVFKVIDTLSLEEITEFTVTLTEAKKDKKYAVSGVELPLYDSTGRQKNYYVVYDATGIQVGNNNLDCSCPGKKFEHQNILQIQGVKSDDLTFTNYHVNNSAYGLQMHFELICDPVKPLCTAPDSFFTTTQFGKLIAKAYQLTWSVKVISYILGSNEINRFTNLSREALYGKRNHYNKLRDDILTTISADLPDMYSHCFVCRPDMGFQKRSL